MKMLLWWRAIARKLQDLYESEELYVHCNFDFGLNITPTESNLHYLTLIPKADSDKIM